MSSFVSRFRDLRSVRKQHQLEQQEQQEKEQQQTPSWPPAPTEKKRGRATRILQTPEPSSSSSTTQQQHPTTSIFNSILFNTTDAREIEKDEAARAMENNRTGALGRLQDKTQSLDQWMHHTGGRKKNDHHHHHYQQQDPSSPDQHQQQQSRFHPHQRKNDDGGTVGRGTVINPDPIIIKGKVRRGMQNEETTNIIASEIQKRQDQREKDIQALEAGRNFHSLFSQQPKIPHGTAHVKPIWDPNDMMRTATPSRLHQQQQQQSQQNHDVNHTNINNNNTSGFRSEQRDISDPLYQKSSPAGLPGVGFVDQARTRHRGKHQYKTAHQLSSIVFDQNNSNNTSNISSDTTHNNNNNDYLPGVHRKIPDGSRGLKVDPLRSQQPDAVKLAFESNPTPIRGKTQFSTTSSSIGNPGAAGELKDFVAGSTRQGPNTRHFGNQGNNYSSSQFPPIGITSTSQNEIHHHRQGFSSVYGGGSGGASSFYRSRTPFPMSSNSMIGNSGSRRHH